MSSRVYWYEDHHENLKLVRTLVYDEIERMKRTHDSRYLREAHHPSNLVHELSTKYAKEHPIAVQIFAHVISIAYQQEQIAGGVSPQGRFLTEKIKPEWKLLVRREDDGRIVEKKPTEVTYYVEKYERPAPTSMPGESR